MDEQDLKAENYHVLDTCYIFLVSSIALSKIR